MIDATVIRLGRSAMVHHQYFPTAESEPLMSADTLDFPIDLTDPEFLAGDRTAAYERLRSEVVFPLQLGPGDPAWVVSRYQDVRAVLRLPEGRVQPVGTEAPPWFDGVARQRLRANLVQIDDPDHARLRNVVGPMFIPRRVEQFREFATESVARAMANVAAKNGEVDAVQDLGVDIPRGVICRFLGIPEEDWQRLTENQHAFLLIFAPKPLGDDERAALENITQFYLDYFDTFVASKSREEHSPFVQLLLEAEDRGDLSHVEVLSLMHTILDAGYETTRTSISNLVEVLCQEPDLLSVLHDEPELIPGAVEELLRYRTPLHVRERYLVDDFELSDGKVLAAGTRVIVMVAGANRDPEQFPDPDRLDLRRENASGHVAFGGGMHHCLGAPIARIQLQETLRGLVAQFGSVDLREDGHRFPDLIFPALLSLPVTFHPRSSQG
ncbi:cytochrome P450 [Aeromicrobium sp. Leaf272]|uniref:cytochrome P450 n=1 Tax=Aeromicrobium sp. Leaf272 TaxID=1736317 RepID=UPI000AC582E3|nr:cytochrome P450 [Aeromicrobium sp. Leaf272]